jgi:hypothetical protein
MEQSLVIINSMLCPMNEKAQPTNDIALCPSPCHVAILQCCIIRTIQGTHFRKIDMTTCKHKILSCNYGESGHWVTGSILPDSGLEVFGTSNTSLNLFICLMNKSTHTHTHTY